MRHAAFWAVLTAAASVAVARADAGSEPERIIMGSVAYPEGSWVVETELEQQMPRWRDEAGDALGQEFSVEHGLTSNLSVEAGFQAGRRRRAAYAVDALRLGGRRSFTAGPLQAAVDVEYRPSLRRRPDEAAVGLEALRNIGRLSAVAVYEGELEKDPGRTRQYRSTVHLAGYWRFGLHGAVGPAWSYSERDGHAAHFYMASALSERLFIGVEPKVGLSPRAPDFALDLVFSLYFGSFGLGEWMIQ